MTVFWVWETWVEKTWAVETLPDATANGSLHITAKIRSYTRWKKAVLCSACAQHLASLWKSNQRFFTLLRSPAVYLNELIFGLLSHQSQSSSTAEKTLLSPHPVSQIQGACRDDHSDWWNRQFMTEVCQWQQCQERNLLSLFQYKNKKNIWNKAEPRLQGLAVIVSSDCYV